MARGCAISWPASPHPRGWTLRWVPGVAAHEGFPAPAGMDPRPQHQPRPPLRLPRTRGDGPVSTAPAWMPAKASPHPRGWTPERDLNDMDARGFPAPAGMGPLPRAAWLHIVRASPHPRGWTPLLVGVHIPPRGFPAPAGMDRAPSGCASSSARLPAPAGMDPRILRPRARRRRLPRTRGDGPSSRRAPRLTTPASPHPRGWTSGGEAADVSPAAAISAGPSPRVREASRTNSRIRSGRGPSPRVRGSRAVGCGRRPAAGSIPAGAGKPAQCGATRPAEGVPSPRVDPRSEYANQGLPRTRGDGPVPTAVESRRLLASPHPRGWTP